MRQARNFYASRAAVAILLFVVGFVIVSAARNRLATDALVSNLLGADIEHVPAIANEVVPLQHMVEADLTRKYPELDRDRALRASLVLLKSDRSREHADFLSKQLLDNANIDEVIVIADALRVCHHDLSNDYWELLEHPRVGEERFHLRAAGALAIWVPVSEGWTSSVCQKVALRLVSAPANEIGKWMGILTPIKDGLIDPLQHIFPWR